MTADNPFAAPGQDTSTVRYFNPPEVTLRDFFSNIFRDLRWIAAIAGVVLLVFVVLAATVKETYVAEARLLALPGQEYSLQTGIGDGQTVTLNRDQIVKGEIEILSSRNVVSEVLTRFGIERIYPGEAWPAGARPGTGSQELADALDRFYRDFDVRALADSNIIRVTIENPDPMIARSVLERLIETYLSYRQSVFLETPVAQLARQRDALRLKLEQAEADLEAFRLEHGITDYDSQLQILLRHEEGLEADLARLTAEIEQKQENAARLEAEFAALPDRVVLQTESIEQDQADPLRATLASIMSQRENLASRYPAESRVVAELDQQISALQERVRRDETRSSEVVRSSRNTVKDQVHLELISARSELGSIQARREVVRSGLAANRTRIDALSALSDQLLRLQRRRDLLSGSYTSFSNRVEAAAAAESIQRERGANVRVVQPPDSPLQEIDRRPLILIAGLFCAIVVAGVVGLLIAWTRTVFISPEEVERYLEVPAPVALTKIGMGGRPRRGAWFGSRRGRSVVPAAPAEPAADPADDKGDGADPSETDLTSAPISGAPPVAAIDAVDDMLIEQGALQRLAQMIEIAPSRSGGRVIEFIAPTPGCHTSRVAHLFSRTLLRFHYGRVALIELFPPENANGAARFGRGGGGAAKGPTAGPTAPGSAVIQAPAGDHEVRASGLTFTVDAHGLSRSRIEGLKGEERNGRASPEAVISELRRSFDFIVLDSAPMTASYEGLIACTYADTVTLVIHAEKTKVILAKILRDRLIEAGVTPHSCVLTNRQFYIPAWLYTFL